MTNEEYGLKLYLKIIEIQKIKKITSTKIAEHIGMTVSGVSSNISSLKKGNLLSLKVIKAIEELSGEKIIKM